MVLQVTNEKARKILISQIMREQALERKNKSPQASWEVITIIFRNNVSIFCRRAAKPFCLLPANLASPETKQGTTFPQHYFLI